MLEIIDSLPLHPKDTMLIYSTFPLAQISWHSGTQGGHKLAILG